MTVASTNAMVKTLFEAGSHLGHKRSRLHPKAKKFVYRVENSVSIIDLAQTAMQVEQAVEYLKNLKKDGKSLLVVATKKIAFQEVAKMCNENNIPHVTTKWLPGLLTNFETIIKNVKKLNDMRAQKQDGGWNTLTKHERGLLTKRLARLEKLYSGIANLTKRPDALLVIDVKREANSVKEAHDVNIPVIGVTDTNASPESVDIAIAANDDSTTSIQALIDILIGAYTTAVVPAK